ncbi:hypothetical protein AAMO2058_000973600 [Amorphochlora amoebiformis]
MSLQAGDGKGARDSKTWWPTPTLRVWKKAVDLGKTDWREAFKILNPVFADNVCFHPPTYWKPKRGKKIALFLLKNVSEIFEDFQYTRCFCDSLGRNAVLEFKCRIPPVPGQEESRTNRSMVVEGVDIIEMDNHGKIIDFKVMVRPPNGALLLKNHMEIRVQKFFAKLAPRATL